MNARYNKYIYIDNINFLVVLRTERVLFKGDILIVHTSNYIKSIALIYKTAVKSKLSKNDN